MILLCIAISFSAQDKKAVPDADRRRTLEPTSLYGQCLEDTAVCWAYQYFLFQIEISHKNQVPMLLAPPPKSRSLFSFLQIPRRKSDDLDEN